MENDQLEFLLQEILSRLTKIEKQLGNVQETLKKFDEMVAAIQDSPLAGMFS